MSGKKPLTDEEAAPHYAALEAAADWLTRSNNAPEAVAAWYAADAAFHRAQDEALMKLPFKYVGGEAPMVGDVIEIKMFGQPMTCMVQEVKPPVVRYGSGDVDTLKRGAEAVHGGELQLHESLTHTWPGNGRLVRRWREVSE